MRRLIQQCCDDVRSKFLETVQSFCPNNEITEENLSDAMEAFGFNSNHVASLKSGLNLTMGSTIESESSEESEDDHEFSRISKEKLKEILTAPFPKGKKPKMENILKKLDNFIADPLVSMNKIDKAIHDSTSVNITSRFRKLKCDPNSWEPSKHWRSTTPEIERLKKRCQMPCNISGSVPNIWSRGIPTIKDVCKKFEKLRENPFLTSEGLDKILYDANWKGLTYKLLNMKSNPLANPKKQCFGRVCRLWNFMHLKLNVQLSIIGVDQEEYRRQIGRQKLYEKYFEKTDKRNSSKDPIYYCKICADEHDIAEPNRIHHLKRQHQKEYDEFESEINAEEEKDAEDGQLVCARCGWGTNHRQSFTNHVTRFAKAGTFHGCTKFHSFYEEHGLCKLMKEIAAEYRKNAKLHKSMDKRVKQLKKWFPGEESHAIYCWLRDRGGSFEEKISYIGRSGQVDMRLLQHSIAQWRSETNVKFTSNVIVENISDEAANFVEGLLIISKKLAIYAHKDDDEVNSYLRNQRLPQIRITNNVKIEEVHELTLRLLFDCAQKNKLL
ncbi:hypothetical protein M3Y95_01028500 [Aphelenchoides besseyi]|nr:hypothetical protein M3Y95_01028500 [Aphelenchoides besseyi]